MALTYFIKDGKYYKRTSSGGEYRVTGSNDLKRAQDAVGPISGSTSTSSGSTSTSTSSKTSTSTYSQPEPTPIDYTFYVNQETPEEYNARIAAARGDSTQELANMQSITQQTYQDQGLSYNSLPKASVPTSATGVTSPYQPYVAPNLSPAFGDITNATAGMAGYGSMLQSSQQFYQDQLAAQQAQNQENMSLIDKFLGSVKSPGQARAQAWDETGIDPRQHFAQQEAGIKEIESLSNEYNRTIEAKDAQIAQSHDRLGSNNFINNQIQQIERNAAPKLNRLSAQINAKAAALEAQQGNFAQAQQYVNQAVADATADTKFKYDMMSLVYETNQDNFDRINSIYQNAFNTSMSIAQTAYEQQLADKRAVGELLLQYPSAGIDIYSDSLNSAIEKAGQVAPTGSGLKPTSDEQEYYTAVSQGYTGTFAEWMGKGDGSNSSAIDTYAMGLFTGDLAITNIPEKYRDQSLAKYYQMLDAQNQKSVTEAGATTSGGTSMFTPVYRDASGNLVPQTRVTASTNDYSTPAYDYYTQTPINQETGDAVWGLLYE